MKKGIMLLVIWGMAWESSRGQGNEHAKTTRTEESEAPLLEQSVVGIGEEESRRFLEAHSKRRNQVLELDADRMKGMKGAQVWAVLMEWGWGKNTESMIAHADGSASFSGSDIKELGEALSISKSEQWSHCMCIGTVVVSLYKGEEELLAFSNHHGKSIRCSLWDSDAVIEEPSRWLSWFDARAMPQLRKEVEESQAQQEKSDRNWERWLVAMPKGVRSAWKGSYGKDGVFDVNPLREALAKFYPEKKNRILALLHWYGSGEGKWNAYPMYEGWAASLIGDYAAPEIVAAIDLSNLTDEQFEGAARFIAQSIYPQDYPKELKRSLWDFVKNTKDEDKRARARVLIE